MQSSRDQVTLDDLARLSGVSRSAASRVINNRPGVRSDVRERVMRIAEEIGFRPNRAARNLASGLSSVVGLVIPSVDLRVDPYAAAMTHAVGRATAAADLGLMLHLAPHEPGATVQHILRDRLIDGVLISAVATGPWVDDLLDSAMPTVLIGSHPARTDIVGVDTENVESSAGAVAHLFEHGCTRVGCITGRLDRADARARLAGYRLAHERAGRELDEALVVRGAYTRRSGTEAATTLLSLGVDGIFASNDEMAVGTMWACARRGARVPDDVKVVGFDGTAIEELFEPSLTSVVQPFDRIAAAAVERLMALVSGGEATSIEIAPALVLGGSTVPS